VRHHRGRAAAWSERTPTTSSRCLFRQGQRPWRFISCYVGHHVLRDAIELSTHAEACGIELGIAINPYSPPHPPDALVREYYEGLTRASSLPLFLFNTMYAGYSVSPELISELADLDNVCGIKNPQPMEHLLGVKKLAGERIVVTDPSERHWLELHLAHGFQSLMSTPALALYQRAGDLRSWSTRGWQIPATSRGPGNGTVGWSRSARPSTAGCELRGSSAA